MQLEEIQNTLNDIQNSTFEYKILNLLFNFYKEQESIKKALMEIQDRLNDTIIEVNAMLEKAKGAEMYKAMQNMIK